MKKIINYNFDKNSAIRLVKKAISGKFAILKDDGNTLKVGAPMMTATIKIDDNTITIEGSGAGGAVASTCATEIEMAVEEYQEKNSSTTNKDPNTTTNTTVDKTTIEEYFSYQEKGINIIRSYKHLLDENIISEEEFNEKKAEVLNFIKGIMFK